MVFNISLWLHVEISNVQKEFASQSAKLNTFFTFIRIEGGPFMMIVEKIVNKK